MERREFIKLGLGTLAVTSLPVYSEGMRKASAANSKAGDTPAATGEA